MASIAFHLANYKIAKVPAALTGSSSVSCFTEKYLSGYDVRKDSFRNVVFKRFLAGFENHERDLNFQWEFDNDEKIPKMKVKMSGPPLKQLAKVLLPQTKENAIEVKFTANLFPHDSKQAFAFVENSLLQSNPEGEFVSGKEDMRQYVDMEIAMMDMNEKAHFENQGREWPGPYEPYWGDWMKYHGDHWSFEVEIVVTVKPDLKVIVKDGAKLCYTSILVGLTPAMDTILQEKLIFGTSGYNVVAMENGTKAGVELLLVYLLSRASLSTVASKMNVSGTIQGLELAFEFNITEFFVDMMSAVLEKQSKEYEANDALQLFLFSVKHKEVGGMIMLTQKATNVLKTKSDEQIMESELFEEAVKLKDFFKLMRNKSCNCK